jgi:hypothetical protein
MQLRLTAFCSSWQPLFLFLLLSQLLSIELELNANLQNFSLAQNEQFSSAIATEAFILLY